MRIHNSYTLLLQSMQYIETAKCYTVTYLVYFIVVIYLVVVVVDVLSTIYIQIECSSDTYLMPKEEEKVHILDPFDNAYCIEKVKEKN